MKKLLLTLALVLAFAVAVEEDAVASETHFASFYGYELAGSLQANGEPFDPEAYTVANWWLPLGSTVTVCYDSCVVATVTDRGPAAWTGKTYDLSYAVARDTGLLTDGIGYVEVHP